MGNSAGKRRSMSAKNAHLRPTTPVPTGNREGAKVEGKDVMISYSHQNSDAMRSIKKLLENAGLSVWVDETELTPGNSYLKEIGEAIVDSSVFLSLLSMDSVMSKFCQDELSLAYISNKVIFAVALDSYEELSPVMDLGMKLTLAAVQWNFCSLETMKSDVQPLIEGISQALSTHKETEIEEHEEGLEEEEDTNFVINKQAFKFRRMMSRKEMASVDESDPADVADKEFWGSNFGKESQVEWSRFAEVLDKSYEDLWKQMMVTDQQKQLLLHLMSKEMAMKQNTVTFRQFKKFCTRGREVLPLSQSIRLYAAQTYAMKEVFDVNSSVRLSAIANLRKYQSSAVIDSLLDILEGEEDPDVIVVAAISLAHAASGMKAFKNRAEQGLIRCLDHKDRLVRESGCLALGRLKSKKSIPKLVEMWRNDYISTVREAAQIAINQIGGEKAEEAMHVTKLLSEEINQFKKDAH